MVICMYYLLIVFADCERLVILFGNDHNPLTIIMTALQWVGTMYYIMDIILDHSNIMYI